MTDPVLREGRAQSRSRQVQRLPVVPQIGPLARLSPLLAAV